MGEERVRYVVYFLFPERWCYKLVDRGNSLGRGERKRRSNFLIQEIHPSSGIKGL